MNKRTCITLAIIAVGLAVCAGFFLFPRQLTPEECGALYQRYKDAEGIDASFIKDFPVNDTLTTDALLLEAATDSAWCTIMVDFGVPEEFIELYISNKDNFINDERNSICEFYRDKNNMKKFLPLDNPDSRIVIGFHAKKTMCIFMTDNPDLKDIISFNEIKKMKKHEKED